MKNLQTPVKPREILQMLKEAAFTAGKLVAGTAVVAGLLGCPTEADSGKTPEKPAVECDCEQKEHYVPCACPASGTEKCDCTIVPRGYVTEFASSVQVPIYQNADVTDEQAETATQNIIDGYNNLSNGNRGALRGKIKEIRIIKTASNGYYDYSIEGGKVILKIQIGLSVSENNNCFLSLIIFDFPGLNLSKLLVRKPVVLADARQAKKSVAPAMAVGKRDAILLGNRHAVAQIRLETQG